MYYKDIAQFINFVFIYFRVLILLKMIIVCLFIYKGKNLFFIWNYWVLINIFWNCFWICFGFIEKKAVDLIFCEPRCDYLQHFWSIQIIRHFRKLSKNRYFSENLPSRIWTLKSIWNMFNSYDFTRAPTLRFDNSPKASTPNNTL